MTAKDFNARPYQSLITDFILDNARCAIWSGMGTGKSVSTLNALDPLLLVEGGPVLIIAPLRVARTTWPDEIRKWKHLRHLRLVTITGSAKERERAAKMPGDIFTTNFESLPWLQEFWGERWPYRIVVVDEATKLKGFRLRQGTARAKALGRVAHSKIKRLILLTGTPSPNGLADLWGQMWFVDKGQRLGRTFDDFRQRWFEKSFDGYSVTPRDHAQAQIQRALADVCITIDAKDWFPLKDPIVNNIYVDMPAKARALYEDMEKRMFMELEQDRKQHQVEAFGAAARTVKCLQIANGAAYVDDRQNWAPIHDGKLDALEEVLEEACGTPVLVAYQFKSDLARLQKAFPDGIWLSSDDGLRRAQRGEGRVWFGHPASMGHGVDGLQEHCNIICFFGMDWNLENRLQIIERVGPTRQMQAGKDRPVFIHNLLARGTVDEMVLERVNTKRAVQDILLDAMKQKYACTT